MRKFLFLLTLLFPAVAGAQTELSVKEFLALSKSDTTAYLVKGVVSKVRSATSGSFYLTDPTGTLLVYGITSPSDPSQTFTQLDIKKGDTLTVRGRFTIYGGTTLEMKDGRLMAKSNGPDHDKSFLELLEKKPSFKGKEGKEGEEAFRQWVQAHIKPCGERGTVRVRYVIGRKGAVQEVQIVRGASPALNEEALRVVRSSPKWKPAKIDGQPVRITYYVDVFFE